VDPVGAVQAESLTNIFIPYEVDHAEVTLKVWTLEEYRSTSTRASG